MNLRAALAANTIMVCDGAMGTTLHAAGHPLDQALPALNLSNPALVRTIHDSYISAGVDIVQTNTFGASRLRLAEHGFGDQVAEINRVGVRIARRAVPEGSGILVAGSVSPPVTVRQRSSAARQARADAVREQVDALAKAGADLIILETFGYLGELVEAIEAAAGVTTIPVIAQATFGPDLLTLSGHSAREVAAAAGELPVAALGTNCTLGPQRSLAVLRELREHTDLPLTFQPNAGLPRRVAAARFEYDVDAEYFARYAREALAAGAAVVGGCCGTTPAQLAAAVSVAGQFRQHRPRRAGQADPAHQAPAASPPAPATLTQPTRRLVIAELIPAQSADVSGIAGGSGGTSPQADVAVQLTEGAGIDLVSVAAASASRTQVSAVDLALQLQQSGIAALASVTTWDRTIMALQAGLLGVHALGLRRIVCETGVPPLVGDYPHTDGIWDVDSIGLIELLAGLNSGIDYYGLRLGTKTDFEIGARINPGSHDLTREAGRAEAKIRAGAGFLITRAIYELDGLERLLAAVGGRVPVYVAIRPLASFAEAEYLAHEVPDVTIPARTLSELRQAGQDGALAGLGLAEELTRSVAELASGIVIAATTDVVAVTTRLLAAAASTT